MQVKGDAETLVGNCDLLNFNINRNIQPLVIVK